MNLKFHKILGFTFFIYIAGFFVLHLMASDQDFSELENRNLAKLPKPQLDTIVEGSFQTDFETYISDHFPLRNALISVKANTERMLLKKENNGVYIGKDGYFLQDFTAPDLELAKRNAGYINKLSHNFPVYVALAPTATKVLEEKLPDFATPYDEGDYITSFYDALEPSVYKVPLLSALEAHSQEPIYYKTDHHWTTLGAYYGYVAFCETAGLTPYPLDQFTIETVTTDFYGSLFSKGNFTYASPDTMQIFYPKEEQSLSVTYNATGLTTDSLYTYDYLSSKDKYSLFLDNNHPLITIKTGVQNGKKLMVIKDSYANCFVPFLTLHYEEIHILDLRLLTIPIQNYATEQGIDDILLLYNVQNFSTEGKLSLLTQ